MFSNTLERLCGLAGALIFLQMPLFIADYQQQLLGRVEELKIQVNAMQHVAGNRPLHDYIQKFITSSDPDFAAQGMLMKNLVHRYESLFSSYQALTEAPFLTKPFYFLASFHQDIAASTFSEFQPGIPLSLEGMIAALFGLLLGTFLYKGFKRLLKLGSTFA